MRFQTFHYKMTDSTLSMTTPPTSPLGFDPVTGQPAQMQPPVVGDRKLIAPIWHTILIIIVLLGNSYVTAFLASKVTSAAASAMTDKERIAQYVFTIGFEFVLLFLVWIGLRIRQTRFSDLIGGRWQKPEAFLLDVAIAAVYWVAAILVLAGLGFLLGLTKGPQVQEAKKLAEALAPHSLQAFGVFVLLSTVAGFVEEILFRGYLQRQFAAITGSVYIAIGLQAAVFGAGHGYEGTRRMILIFVYGLMFGLLAFWRKSLRPGMIAHAWHDSFEGAVLFFIARKGFPSMP
jgi:CAAX protease family protein